MWVEWKPVEGWMNDDDIKHAAKVFAYFDDGLCHEVYLSKCMPVVTSTGHYVRFSYNSDDQFEAWVEYANNGEESRMLNYLLIPAPNEGTDTKTIDWLTTDHETKEQ